MLSDLLPNLLPAVDEKDKDDKPNYNYLCDSTQWSAIANRELIGRNKSGLEFPITLQVAFSIQKKFGAKDHP